jgi:hypothetical protein
MRDLPDQARWHHLGESRHVVLSPRRFDDRMAWTAIFVASLAWAAFVVWLA